MAKSALHLRHKNYWLTKHDALFTMGDPFFYLSETL